MKLSQIMAAAMLASVLMITLSACDSQGPFEEAGEEIDDTADDAGDAFD